MDVSGCHGESRWGSWIFVDLADTEVLKLSRISAEDSVSLCNCVVGYVGMCQQTLVIMTYLLCLFWQFPTEATPRLNDLEPLERATDFTYS